MEIILKFDGIEETSEAQTALDGWKWKNILFELDQELRQCTKHGLSFVKHNQEATDEEYEVLEKLRSLIHLKIDENGLNLND